MPDDLIPLPTASATTQDALNGQARRARRQALAQSFTRGAQTAEEALASARTMAAALDQQGLLLRAPAR